MKKIDYFCLETSQMQQALLLSLGSIACRRRDEMAIKDLFNPSFTAETIATVL